MSLIDTYSDMIRSDEPTLAAILDEKTALTLLANLLDTPLSDWDSLYEQNAFNIRIYDIENGKKQFSIETIRLFQQDIALKPYEGKIISVLRHFDTAGLPAQNAILKTLEESPPYVVILLVVESPTSLIDTILSRSVNLFQSVDLSELPSETRSLLDAYLTGDILPWITHIYSAEYSREEMILIFSYIYSSLTSSLQRRACRESIESLFTSNESEKNIFFAFFLGTMNQ